MSHHLWVNLKEGERGRKGEENGLFLYFQRAFCVVAESILYKATETHFLFRKGDHFVGHLQLYNRAESFKEILIYYETTIEWSLESLAEGTIKGIPNGVCFQCQEIQKVLILDVCLQSKKSNDNSPCTCKTKYYRVKA